MKPTVKSILFRTLIVGTPILALILFTAHQLPTAAPTNTHVAHQDLRQLMQDRIHVEFTQMSFTLWHDRPLTPSKMDSISTSATHMAGYATDLQQYATVLNQQGWSRADVQFFDQNRLQLLRVSAELNQAARQRDQTQMTNFFMHLETTCNACHHRFRPDLS